jgi:hypothetical protein
MDQANADGRSSATGALQDPAAYLVELFREGRRSIGHPPLSPVEWLEREYRESRDAHFRSAVERGIVEILSRPIENTDEHGEVLASVLALVERIRPTEAVTVLKKLVRAPSRPLSRPVGDYTDLHGRALVALVKVDAEVDLDRMWRDEWPYRDYVPLVFSLLRDHTPDRLPSLMHPAFQLQFLWHALHSIRFELPCEEPDDEGAELLGACADAVRPPHMAAVRLEFLDTLRALRLPPAVERRIRARTGSSQRSRACLYLGEATRDEVTSLLREDGVDAVTWTPWMDLGPSDIFVADETLLREEPELVGKLRPAEAVVAAFPRGKRTPDAWTDAGYGSFTVHDSEMAARTIHEHVLRMLDAPPREDEYEPPRQPDGRERGGEREPSDWTAEPVPGGRSSITAMNTAFRLARRG